MFGFTGDFRGAAVSVMAHGMGIPSASIYCTELIRDFGVQRVIRVGSCGTVNPEVKLRDIVIATGASTDSGVNRARFGGHDLAAIAVTTPIRFTSRKEGTEPTGVAERTAAGFPVQKPIPATDYQNTRLTSRNFYNILKSCSF